MICEECKEKMRVVDSYVYQNVCYRRYRCNKCKKLKYTSEHEDDPTEVKAYFTIKDKKKGGFKC